MGILTLLTDFGLDDTYVAQMRGVIASVAPDVRVIDLTHAVPPQDVMAGAWHLYAAVPYFPPGTVHVAVVDPGVGGDRRAIAVQAGEAFFVAPDNGLLTYVLAAAGRWEGVVLDNPAYYRAGEVSWTFHGRDIFAPVGAHLARGIPLHELGSPLDDPIRLSLPEVRWEREGVLVGCVLHIDRFGNLITNLGRMRWLGEGMLEYDPAFQMGEKHVFPVDRVVVEVGGRRVALQHTYAEVEMGEPLALVGSHGHLEIAVAQGSARYFFGVGRGSEVRLIVDPEASRER